MLHSTLTLKRLAGAAFAVATLFGAASDSQAALIKDATYVPTAYAPAITSGALPDSPNARIDPNLSTSPFSRCGKH